MLFACSGFFHYDVSVSCMTLYWNTSFGLTAAWGLVCTFSVANSSCLPEWIRSEMLEFWNEGAHKELKCKAWLWWDVRRAILVRRHTAFSGTDQPKRGLVDADLLSKSWRAHRNSNLLSTWYVGSAFHPPRYHCQQKFKNMFVLLESCFSFDETLFCHVIFLYSSWLLVSAERC